MTIEVNRDVCIGSGNCVASAPEVFDQDDDGIVVLLPDQPTEATLESAREAVDYCPSAALRLHEA